MSPNTFVEPLTARMQTASPYAMAKDIDQCFLQQRIDMGVSCPMDVSFLTLDEVGDDLSTHDTGCDHEELNAMGKGFHKGRWCA